MIPLGRSFDPTSYAPILKWKAGERRALRTACVPKQRLIPIFDMPPAGDFDHEEQRPVTPTEHLGLFGRRLEQCCGSRAAFIDALLVDDELHRKELKRHPLTELLERARLAGALALPVTSIGQSKEYQNATKGFLDRNDNFPICIRVTSSDLDSKTFSTDLRALICQLGCSTRQVFLVIDMKDQEIGKEMLGFIEIVQVHLNELPFLYDWLGLALVLSSFPPFPNSGLKCGEVKAFPRTDLPLYRKLVNYRDTMLRMPMFGDYALDRAPLKSPGGGFLPTAHLRYSAEGVYLTCRGQSVKKPVGYGAIYPVADLIVARPEFMGKQYSEGDLFMSNLSQRTEAPGNASSWRWAATDHHLTSNFKLIDEVFGIEEAQKVPPKQPEEAQASLFPDL